jgi:hypothetical protein
MKQTVKWASGLVQVLCWTSFALLVMLVVLSWLYWDLLAQLLGEWFFARVGACWWGWRWRRQGW